MPKYNSQELDTETGFYFYNARHYDPVIARFVTADSVVDGELSPMGWNRYMYVHGNPIRYMDPTGHATDYQKIIEESTSSPDAKETFNNAMSVWIKQEHAAMDIKLPTPNGANKFESGQRKWMLKNNDQASLKDGKDKWKEFDSQFRNKMALLADARAKLSSCVEIKHWLENTETAGRPMPSIEEINEQALSIAEAKGIFAMIAGATIGVAQTGGLVGRSSRPPKVNTQASKGGGQKLSPPRVRGNPNTAPENGTIYVDPKGNAIVTPKGGRLSGSPDGRYVQARDAYGNPTGVRIDAGHSPKSHTDPRSLQPHGHVPGVTNKDGTPWLPIK